MESIIQMIEELNNYNEFCGKDVRYWVMNDGRYVVCYNATTDMDDIHEISEKQIKEDIKKMINELPWWEKED